MVKNMFRSHQLINLSEFKKLASHLWHSLTVRPELVEGWTVKPFMVRQAHHERLNHKIIATLFATSAVFSSHVMAATNIGISPTQVNLSPSNKTGMITVLNKGENPVNLQLDAKSWDMDENGKFIETDTGDFIFYPKTLTIKPHDQATIRVGYIGAEFPKAEKPYRLFVEEMPDIKQPEPEKNKIKIGLTSVLRLSMPLYVVSVSDIPAPQVELAGLKTEAQKLRIGVKNPTAYHVTLKKVTIKLLKADKVLTEKAVEPKLQRILGEHQIFVDLPVDTKKLCQQADALQVQIELDNLKEPYQTKVALKPGCLL
jgi:P pilus assembly chaperone PapD